MEKLYVLTTIVVVLFFGILTNQGYAFSPACPSQTKPYRYAIKSFSSGKYLRVNGDNASDTLRVSFTGHFNACDTRILFYRERILDANRLYLTYNSVAFPSRYLAVDKRKLVLSKQSQHPTPNTQHPIESKFHFMVSRVKVAYNFDGWTLYHAVNPRDSNSTFIRSSKSGKITLRKRWKFDCGAWLFFNCSIPSCSS